MPRNETPWKATKCGDFLRKIAIDYARYGYVYHSGIKTIPEGKQLWRIDKKLLATYEVTYTSCVKDRKKKQGIARVAYVRLDREFILMATEGEQTTPFKVFTKYPDRDLRVKPLIVRGYAIYLQDGTPVIEVEPTRFSRQSRFVLSHFAKHPDYIVKLFRTVSPFHFPGIVRQKRTLLDKINARRRKANLSKVEINLSFNLKTGEAKFKEYLEKKRLKKQDREQRRRKRGLNKKRKKANRS